MDYYQLSPDMILDALESVGLNPEVALLPLNSYENRVYQFKDENADKYVVKFYRPNRWSDEQILEEHQFCLALQENEIPIVAPLLIDSDSLLEYEGFKFSVFPCKGGRNPELESEEVLTWLGRFIARIHLLGQTRNYQARPEINILSYGKESIAFLKQCEQVPEHLQESYFTIAEQVLSVSENTFQQYPYKKLRIHCDCHPSNILWTDQGPHFVDFDDSRMGPAVQDLWMLITGDEDDKIKQRDALLSGYEEFREFDYREMNLIEPLRALRIIHYTCWIARRWDDPSFKHHFSWFGNDKYWEQQILILKEQLSLLY